MGVALFSLSNQKTLLV